jgi:hypothetical protein
VQQQTGRPPGRYGDQDDGDGRAGRRRRLTVAAVVALAALFVGWVVWAGLDAASPDLHGDVTAFRVTSDDAIRVRVALAGSATGPVGCSVQALDRTRGVVGVGTIVLDPGSDRGRQGWVTLRTRDKAVAATVGRCTPVAPAEQD